MATSKMGYIPDDKKDLANNLQVDANPEVLYAAPTGFHLVSTGADTDTAYSARELLGGMILQPAGASPRTKSFPTAAALVAAANGAAVNMSLRLTIRNTDGSNSVVIDFNNASSTGVTFSPAADVTIPANTTGELLLVFTNVTSGSEAVTAYLLADNLSSA